METIVTKDGSVTYKNNEYDETYHSVSGAIEETIKKFIEPCKISSKNPIRVLDIGFGLGYNAIAAIDFAPGEIEVISFEKNLILEELKKLDPPLKNYGIVKKLELDPMTNSYLYEDSRVHLRIMVGDAVLSIKKAIGKFDAVFLDAFSPKKNPELWTHDFFSDVKKKMKDDAILATYSCARVVRDNLKAAGFIVEDGPIVGRRSPGTLARIK